MHCSEVIPVLAGITNTVPSPGPLIGTVPRFLLYIIVLQQVERNFIYPRVVGHSIGRAARRGLLCDPVPRRFRQ